MATALKSTTTAKRPTGADTRMIDRRRLPDGSPNMSRSGELPNVVEPEAGIVPLKAVNQITYGNAQVAMPGSLFVPISATERAELLLGDYPPAEEPSTAELRMFSESNTDFG